MNIRLTQIGASTDVDLTNLLDDDSEVRLAQSQEDAAFEREVDDVHLNISNADGQFSTLFGPTVGTTEWRIEVSEGTRVLFRGQIENNTIIFSVDDLWLEFDCFSLNRIFWDRAQETKVRTRRAVTAHEPDEVYVTLQYILERELTGKFRANNAFEGLFHGFDWGGFETEQIRFSKTTLYRSSGATAFTPDSVRETGATFGGTPFQTGCYVTALQVLGGSNPSRPLYGRINRTINIGGTILVDKWEGATEGNIPTNGLAFTVGIHPTIGLEGLFTCIDPNTTVDELLQAIAREKNAEFFIDPETRKFTMRARNAVLNDRAVSEGLDADDILIREPKPRIQYVDEQQYDYVKINIGDTRAPKPELRSITQRNAAGGILGYGLFSYQTTLQFEGYESNGGEILEVTLPGTDIFAASVVTLTIPASRVPGVISRRLFRTDFFDAEKRLRFLADIPGDAQVSYTDSRHNIYDPGDPYLIANTIFPPEEKGSVGMWIRFDEETGLWDDPILNLINDEAAPSGSILDVTPELKFITLNDKTKQVDNNEYHALKFFANEAYSEKFRTRWLPEFRTKRKVIIGVEGINFRVGDSIKSRSMLFGNDRTSDDRLLMRRVANLLKKEESELELVTI